MSPDVHDSSQIFGWDFDSLLLLIRQQTCEALSAMSRMTEAAESLRGLLNEFEVEVAASETLSSWL